MSSFYKGPKFINTSLCKPIVSPELNFLIRSGFRETYLEAFNKVLVLSSAILMSSEILLASVDEALSPNEIVDDLYEASSFVVAYAIKSVASISSILDYSAYRMCCW